MRNRWVASILMGVSLVLLLQQGCASMREEHYVAITKFTEDAQMFREKAKYLKGVAEAYDSQQGADRAMAAQLAASAREAAINYLKAAQSAESMAEMHKQALPMALHGLSN